MNTEQFWQKFLQENDKDLTSEYYECFYFDINEESANELLALVLAGEKTATASSALAMEIENRRFPQVGDYSIVTDFAGNPHCIIETVAVTLMKFNEMTYDICKREGEDDTLESWRNNHRHFFGAEGEMLGYEFTEDMLIIFEDFKVVYRNEQ